VTLCARSGLQAAPVILAAALAGCTHAGFGSQSLHYATFSVPEAQGMTVHVCHAYGCRKQTKFTFRPDDVESLRHVMAEARGQEADTPEQERRAVAYAIGWIERRVGEAIGTKDDRAGMDFAGSSDPTQQDCVDEATNTTSYLNVLVSAGLIKHHTVGVPFAKENYLRGVEGWTHWTAVLVEKPFAGIAADAVPPRRGSTTKMKPQTVSFKIPPSPGGQRWAVDSWIYANGENPAIVKAEDWYIAGLDDLPAPTR
jgi:hypothetical protein